MISRTIKITFTIISLTLISCNSTDQSEKFTTFKKEFVGLWAETEWTYKFNEDGSFVFKSDGHYDISTDSGIYVLIDSLILLSPETDWKMYDGVLKTRLKIISDNCIRDFDDNYYCESTDSLNFHIDKEYEWQEQTKLILDSLPVVIKAKSKNENMDPNSFPDKFDFYKIIVIEGIEYYSFRLKRRDGLEYFTLLKMLIKKDPFEIYQHHSKGDSLSLIYK